MGLPNLWLLLQKNQNEFKVKSKLLPWQKPKKQEK